MSETTSTSASTLTPDKIQEALNTVKRIDLQRRSDLSHALRKMSKDKSIWIREGDKVIMSANDLRAGGIDTNNLPKEVEAHEFLPSGHIYIIKREALYENLSLR